MTRFCDSRSETLASVFYLLMQATAMISTAIPSKERNKCGKQIISSRSYIVFHSVLEKSVVGREFIFFKALIPTTNFKMLFRS